MLSDFRKRKLKLMFSFHDFNNNGVLEEDDFRTMGGNTIQIHGYDPESPEAKKIVETNMMMWENIKSRCDLNSDGKITFEEFAKGYHAWMMEDKDYFSQLIHDSSKDTFAMLDVSGDQKISRQEYLNSPVAQSLDAMFEGLGDNWTREEMFDRLDTDGSGYISADEIHQHMMTFYYSDDPSEAGNYICGPLPQL